MIINNIKMNFLKAKSCNINVRITIISMLHLDCKLQVRFDELVNISRAGIIMQTCTSY